MMIPKLPAHSLLFSHWGGNSSFGHFPRLVLVVYNSAPGSAAVVGGGDVRFNL